MYRNAATALLTLGSILTLARAIPARQIGDTPAVTTHLSQVEIDAGRFSFDEVVAHGRKLFTAVFNRLDGQGAGRGMAHSTGPDAHSCASCHNQPRLGGGGDFAANGFVTPSAERNTLGLFGSGPIEMLALEMTRELQAIRMVAVQRAFLSSANVPAHLVAKGIDFGWIVARADGSLDTSGVRGIDPNLVIKPFHQHGAAVSLRQFTNEGMNSHMGLQSQELFGIDFDDDGDGIANELTVGDITALSLYQAQLGTPGRVIPDDPVRRQAAFDGEALFNRIGCADCHIPAMKLNNRFFTEPNPFNPEWKLPATVTAPIGFDMTSSGEEPRLEPTSDGGAIVRAYTDLKRHNLCDAGDRYFCNESSAFLTRKLWDVGSSAPYGHRGDLSTITEAIEHHAGEARPARTNFVNLPASERAAIIEFLKTLQILPAGAGPVITEHDRRSLVQERRHLQP